MDFQKKKGCCIWLNGPNGSGRNQLARMLEDSLKNREMLVECLDEETIEAQLGSKSESPENADAGLLRAIFTAHLLIRNGVTVIISAGIENQYLRSRVRDRAPHLVEVAVNVPAGTESMDGEEEAIRVKPEIILNTDQEQPREEKLAENLAQLIKFLEISGRLPALKQAELTEKESALVKERLKALGYL